MDFYEKDNYNIDDIKALIDSCAEENVHLEFKRASALSKDDADKITKTFSAFANSDGGVIVYGIAEENHVAGDYSFVDGNKVTTERISQIARYIQPAIDGLHVFPVRKDGDFSKSIYVVQVPRSDKAPHMAKDHRYYKRNNVESLPMEDYDVKDVMSRIYKPKLGLVGCFLNEPKSQSKSHETIDFISFVMIGNYGRVLSRDYKLISYLFFTDDTISPKFSPINPHETKAKSLVISDMSCTKISFPSLESIFPNEKMEIGHATIEVPIEGVETFINKAFILSTLYWEDGGREDMLSFFNGKDSIYERDEIVKYIPDMLEQYILGDTQGEKSDLSRE